MFRSLHLKYSFLFLTTFIFCSNSIAQTSTVKGYGKATINIRDAGSYIKTWLLLDPVSITDAPSQITYDFQKEAFEIDLVKSVVVKTNKKSPPLKIKSKKFNWKEYTSGSDTINLERAFSKLDYVYTYALAEVIADSASTVVLAVGSDDGIKVWQNGKLIHSKWIGRGIKADDDLIFVNLQKGSNQFLFKIQDMTGGWGFMARFYNKPLLNKELMNAAEAGDLEKINLLIAAGADLNIPEGKFGPLHAAEIAGRTDAESLLIQKGVSKTPMPAPENIIDELYQIPIDKFTPGVVILVSKDGEILYDNAFGYADIEKKKRCTSKTKFRIGSITKQFAGAAILKLQEEGLLNVQDKLSKFIPDFPRGNEVTIHHLLTHTSGIHSHTQKADFMEKVTTPVTQEEVINYFKNEPYDFNPGEEFRYNNAGYFLLGYIIEKTSGKTYSEYLKNKFFIPLEMNNTGVYSTDLKLSNEAKGYSKDANGSYKLAVNWNMNWAGAAGALYSTVEDLYKWNEALAAGKVLNEASLKLAFNPVVLNNGKTPAGIEYGYGWFLGKYRGIESIGHSGGVDGFISQLTRYPKENMTVVMLTNISPPEVNLNPNRVVEVFLWKKMAKQAPVFEGDISEELLKSYAGRYEITGGIIMKMRTDGKKLFSQVSGQNEFEIYPSSANEFYWKVVDAKIKFVENNGQVKQAKFSQNGIEMELPKLPDLSIVNVDTKLYDEYIGKYNLGNNFFITVIKEQNKIFAQGTNQPRFELFPLSDTEFMIKEVVASIMFVKDEKGKISKMILSQNGKKMEGKRVE